MKRGMGWHLEMNAIKAEKRKERMKIYQDKPMNAGGRFTLNAKLLLSGWIGIGIVVSDDGERVEFLKSDQPNGCKPYTAMKHECTPLWSSRAQLSAGRAKVARWEIRTGRRKRKLPAWDSPAFGDHEHEQGTE